MRIILGLIGIVLSFVLIVYRVPINHFIGGIDWAERKLGPGGSYTALVIIALLLFAFSLMYMTNSFGVIFGSSPVDFFGSST